MNAQDQKLVERLKREHGLDFDLMIENIKSYNPNLNVEKFKEAFSFAARAHDGQIRKQKGIPYIVHPFETAKILTMLHSDETTLIASFLHDVPEDTEYTLENIETKFGKKVAYLVEGITKLSKVHYRHDMKKRDVESLKKMFIHFAKDPRTILIKLADRLHNARTFEFMDSEEKRIRKAKETLEIYAPIAGLLGIYEIQRELEILCFKNLYPSEYFQLLEIVKKGKKEHTNELNEMLQKVEKELKDMGIDGVVYSHEKNVYHIFQKLLKDKRSIQDYEHSFRINILVEKPPDCYKVLGLLHHIYRPLNGGVIDYIAVPKANGYQSLHTSVFGHSGILTKFHVRTHKMHYEAQFGIASRFFFSDFQQNKFELDLSKSKWLNEIIEIQEDEIDKDQFLEDLKADILNDRITIFTPEGKAINLINGSTCIDFAYQVHTQIGHRAVRAVVNEQNVALSHVLNNNDVVKIITTNYPKSPSYEWLSFAKSTFAKKKMKEYLKKESRISKIKVGRKILQKEYDRAGLGIVKQISKYKINALSSLNPRLEINNFDDILAYLAEGNLKSIDIIKVIFTDLQQKNRKENNKNEEFKSYELSIKAENDFKVAGLIDLFQTKNKKVKLKKAQIKQSKQDLKIIIGLETNSYNNISMVCSLIEQMDGIKTVNRVFKQRKLFLILGMIATFVIWVAGQIAFYSLISNFGTQNMQLALAANILLFSTILVLTALIYGLKNYTNKAMPDLREKRTLWISFYSMVMFLIIVTTVQVIFIDAPIYKIAYYPLAAILTIIINYFFFKNIMQKH